MPDEPQPEPDEAPAEIADPLSGWPRAFASIAGVAGLGTGGVSVFMTTNQAGSVALLAVGTIFLTVAVNGAPLIGAKLPGYELIMATRRKKIVDAAKHDEPDEGERKLEVLEQIDPASREDPGVIAARTDLYRKNVEFALARAALLGSELMAVHSGQFKDRWTDLEVIQGGLSVDVEIAYSTSSSDALLGTHSLEFTFTDAVRTKTPRLLITNMRIPNDVADIAKKYDPDNKRVQVARWRDRQDDMALRLALTRLGIDTGLNTATG
jgi:hypothetical protein